MSGKQENSPVVNQEAINEFLTLWKRRKNVTGAFLVGSYATGLATSQSDIDICIILRDTARYWQCGNTMVSGFLVEYAAYSISYLSYLQERDLKEKMRLRTRMLATGIILFDKLGILNGLQQQARQLIKKKLPAQTRELTEIYKYLLWDQLDNLQDLQQRQAPGFAYAYYVGLQDILRFYAAFLRSEIPRPTRINSFLTSTKFQKQYGIAPLPDPYFCQIFESAMHGPSLSIFKQLTDHVHNRMGGFSIDGWTLRRCIER